LRSTALGSFLAAAVSAKALERPETWVVPKSEREGRNVKDGERKIVTERQLALAELVKAIREFRKFTDQPLTLRGGDYAGPSTR
jgi:hypothetical protein